MLPLSHLQYARKYPFSSVAKSVVKQLAPDISQLGPQAFDTVFLFLEAGASHSPKERRKFVVSHFSRKDLSYPEFLSNDVLSFPLAKILLSLLRNPILFERFASLMGDLTFEYLTNESDRVSVLLELANDLQVKMDIIPNENNPSVLIPLEYYLSFPFKDGQLHLVNQSVSHGWVELELNSACRWVAEGVHFSVLRSLPVDTKGLPKIFWEMAQTLSAKIQTKRTEEMKAGGASGIILPAFPPCMDKLYSEILSGVNLPHMARFDLATFLVNIDMPLEDIMNVFSKASNYDEKVTRYHVGNLSGKTSGKKYSSPACAKVREHGLCISRTCNVMHPLQFYERESSNPVKEEKKIIETNELNLEAKN